MRDEGILKYGFKAVFLRYLTLSLFDRFTSFLIVKIIKNGSLTERDKEHLLRMRSLATLLSEPAESKLYLQWFQEFEFNLLNYEIEISVKRREQLIKTNNLSQQAIYPFKLFS